MSSKAADETLLRCICPLTKTSDEQDGDGHNSGAKIYPRVLESKLKRKARERGVSAVTTPISPLNPLPLNGYSA
jgi:hypothetical protein